MRIVRNVTTITVTTAALLVGSLAYVGVELIAPAVSHSLAVHALPIGGGDKPVHGDQSCITRFGRKFCRVW
jgi:hypothetical protein